MKTETAAETDQQENQILSKIDNTGETEAKTEQEQTGAPPVVPQTLKQAQPKKLLHNRIQGAEFVRNLYCITPEAGTDIQDILMPDFYAHLTKIIKIGDKLEAVPDDMQWYAELLVQDVGPGFAQVSLLRHIELESIDPRDELAGITIEWAGRHKKYRVMRGGEELDSKFSTQSKAREWAEQYVKRIAR
jgi:hypothetical protein